MGKYDDFEKLAVELLTQFGTTVQLVHKTTTTTAGKPWEATTPTETIEQARAAFFNYNARELETLHKYGDGEALLTDRKCIIAAKGITRPEPQRSAIRVGGQEYSIEFVQTVQPDLVQPIIYTARVRL